MKKICSSIREHVTNVINIEKKKMLPSTKRDKITPKCDDMLHLWKKIHKKVKDKNYWKVRDHWNFTGKYRGAVPSICNLRFNFPQFFAMSQIMITIS